jgi:hypothetical protein
MFAERCEREGFGKAADILARLYRRRSKHVLVSE